MDHGPEPATSGRPEGKPVAAHSIGEAARRLGVAAHVLRHWEDEQVLVPGRDALGHRRYTEPELTLAGQIRGAQQAGMSLAQIRDFIAADAESRAATLAAHRARLLADAERLAWAAASVGATLDAPPAAHCPYGFDPA